ncbi:hypothetical protein [Bradyrhizobium sp. USDA 372]
MFVDEVRVNDVALLAQPVLESRIVALKSHPLQTTNIGRAGADPRRAIKSIFGCIDNRLML